MDAQNEPAMWEYQDKEIGDNAVKTKLFEDGDPMSFRDVLDHWMDSVDFRNFYNDLLADQSFESYFWEHPPMTNNHLDREYEFVLVDSKLLPKVNPDPHTFSQYFKEDDHVTTFPNLGGDATLIAPCPEAEHEVYTDLAPFVRHAPDRQIHSFWQTVGSEFKDSLNDRAKWLSTAGMGVYWLHARIDTVPKYYRHKPYKSMQ